MNKSYVFSLKSFYIYYMNALIIVFLIMVFFVFLFLVFFYFADQFFQARIPVKLFEMFLMLFSANLALAAIGAMAKRYLKENKDIFRPKQLILEDDYFLYRDTKGREHTCYWSDVKRVSIMMMKMGYRAKVETGNFSFIFFSYEFEEIPESYKMMTKTFFSSDVFMDILKVFRQKAQNALWKKDLFLTIRQDNIFQIINNAK